MADQPAPESKSDESLTQGDVYARFALPNLDGTQHAALSDYRGRPLLVVHFAAGHKASCDQLLDLRERTAALVKGQKLWLLPVAHDHYADRVRLFVAAHGIKEMIAHDLLNLTGTQRLPRLVYVPAKGSPRELDSDQDIDKLIKTLGRAKPGRTAPIPEEDRELLPESRVTRRAARDSPSPEQMLAHADALVLAGKPPQIEEAIEFYRQVVAQRPKDAVALMRLGIAYRLRFDRPERQPGDLAAAIDAWNTATKLDMKCDPAQLRLAPLMPSADKAGAPYGWMSDARDRASKSKSAAHLDIEPLCAEVGQSPAKAAPRDQSLPKDRSAVRVEHAQVTRRVGKSDHVAILLAFIPDSADGFAWGGGEGPSVYFGAPRTGKLTPESAGFVAKFIGFGEEGGTAGDDDATSDDNAVRDEDAQTGAEANHPKSPPGADDRKRRSDESGQDSDRADRDAGDAAPKATGERPSESNVYNEPSAARPRLMLFRLTMPPGKRAKGMTLKGAATYSVTRGSGPAQTLMQPFEISLR